PSHHVIAGNGLVGEELIRVIEGFAFIDLRGAVPDAIRSGVVLGRIEDALGALMEITPLTHVVWVVAPWVLELFPDAELPRVERLVGSIAPPIAQRLAILPAQGEPVGDHELTRRLGHKLRPLAERLQWKTQDR